MITLFHLEGISHFYEKKSQNIIKLSLYSVIQKCITCVNCVGTNTFGVKIGPFYPSFFVPQ